ncbi:Short-chain dehydrogenase/reductase iacJ [Cladobotryum mycophilum]|uniref:Short-chain dehydrogenase/reductase iacJ n=1 Tax=Cladobotryum mycophilum TaxID=491253 RepID=A0ABR0SWZ6_9HYPO
MGAQWSQFFPPKPTFTAANVEPQNGKVFIVTGGYSGIGFELAKMLYQKNGRVYIAGRSEEKAREAIRLIQVAGSSEGSLEFLSLKLDDLSSIKASAEEFKAKESKLHILWNNAGVSQPPIGSVSAQGIELQLATNCVGPFLFTQLLLPLLQATASDDSNPPGSVRVVWTGSQIVELSAPAEGIIMDELHTPPKDKMRTYTNSKTGNNFLASELARRVGPSHGIISVAQNPGAASSNITRHAMWMKIVMGPLSYKSELCALTELYAGLSKDITIENNACYIVPFGRIVEIRKDLVNAMKPTEEGGTGRAAEFWDFCFEKSRDYM